MKWINIRNKHLTDYIYTELPSVKDKKHDFEKSMPP